MAPLECLRRPNLESKAPGDPEAYKVMANVERIMLRYAGSADIVNTSTGEAQIMYFLQRDYACPRPSSFCWRFMGPVETGDRAKRIILCPGALTAWLLSPRIAPQLSASTQPLLIDVSVIHQESLLNTIASRVPGTRLVHLRCFQGVRVDGGIVQHIASHLLEALPSPDLIDPTLHRPRGLSLINARLTLTLTLTLRASPSAMHAPRSGFSSSG